MTASQICGPVCFDSRCLIAASVVPPGEVTFRRKSAIFSEGDNLADDKVVPLRYGFEFGCDLKFFRASLLAPRAVWMASFVAFSSERPQEMPPAIMFSRK